jgi:hypothetical protein
MSTASDVPPVSGDIEQRLGAAAQAVREREVTVKRCSDLRARQSELETELASLQERYASEQQDVERLESMSLTRVLASLAGARDERLARERAEAGAARYRVAEAQARLDAVRADQRSAQDRLARLESAPVSYAAVLDEKERYLTASGDARGRSLLSLAAERGQLTAELKETNEAIQAAAAALDALSQVQERLGSASGWSAYDTWFGGGMIASSIKHERMDAAAQAAAAADQRLAVLRTELADVGDPGLTAPQLAVSGGTRFVDVWFDNFFTDIAVGDRIRQAQRQVAESVEAVDRLRARLTSRASTTQARLNAIEAERDSLLTAR